MSFIETLNILNEGDLDPLGLHSQVQSGFGSRGMFALQEKTAAGVTPVKSAYDNYVDDLSKFYQQMYEGISWGVVQNAPPIVANRIRANRNPVPNTRGRVDVSGGISLQTNTRSMLPFIKHATMTAGKGTRGQDVTSTFSTFAALTATDMTKVAGTTTWRYTPGSNFELLYDTTKQSAFETALGGSDNGFGDVKSAPPTQLDITLSNIQSLSDATILIRATDQNGIVLEETYPITLTIIGLTGTVPEYGVVRANEPAGTVKIRTRYNYANLVPGSISIEVKGATETTGNQVQIAIDVYTTEVAVGASNPIIPAMKNTSRSCFEIVKAIRDPMTIYLVKGGNPHESGQEGGIPNVYTGCYINSFTLNVAETIMFDMDFIGRNGYTRVTPATVNEWGNEWGRAVVPPDPYEGSTPSPGWNFAAPINPVMTGWESGLQIKELGQTEWITVPCSDFNFNLNNQLTHNERYWFRRWHTEPTPSAALDAMVNGTVDYRTAQGYDFLQVQNLPVEARMICFSRDVGAKESYIIAHIGEAVLNETVDPAVSGEDVITQSFTLKCLSKGERAFGTRSYADTLETYQERSPIVFEVASDQVLTDIAA